MRVLLTKTDGARRCSARAAHACCKRLVPKALLRALCVLLALELVAGANAVDYTTQIKPLLTEKCYSCHGRLKQESDLRLETRSLIVSAGVVIPGRPDASELIRRVSSADDDDRMPPPQDGAALKSDEIELLAKWIAEGAAAPEERVPPSPADHWAFQPITRAEVPRASHRGVNAIDTILDQQRDRASLKLQPQANRGILLRRLYLDLVGLPPTLEQLRDSRPWEQIVDELLANPQHGERWGRHWMDVWRYCDWYGLGAQLRVSQKHIWHWRDWIVESLNADKGYDQMIREMLAADEIAPLDTDALRATGYLARNYYLFNRTTWLDSTIEHTGKAFLGLTFNCAKCHDHKYDPISQLDYYQMRAIFEPHQVRLDPIEGVTDFETNGLPRVFDDHIDEPTFVHLRGNPKTPDTETVVHPGVPGFLSKSELHVSAVALPYEAYAPGARPHVQRARLSEASMAVNTAREALLTAPEDQRTSAESRLELAQATLAAVAATIAADKAAYQSDADEETIRLLGATAALLQAEQQVASAHLKLQEAGEDSEQAGIATELVKEAEQALVAAECGESIYTPIRGAKKALESPADDELDYPAIYAKVSTGRRTALAEWITSRENPLTARVAVNHVWMRHFGQPLVESEFDFGLRAPPPANLKLLDFLAHEFMASGWSFRHLHRLMVTSRTYRLSSSTAGADKATLATDPNNQYYWRMNTRRMESQVVRDSLLCLAGELDTTMGGPSVEADGPSKRRSIYFKHSRDDQNRFLKMFDDADRLQCYRRTASIVPQQALALANSGLTLEMAKKIENRLWNSGSRSGWDSRWPSATKWTDGEPSERLGFHASIATVFESLLARPPSDKELNECLQFFVQLSALTPQPDDRTKRVRFVHALLNHNDFISIR